MLDFASMAMTPNFYIVMRRYYLNNCSGDKTILNFHKWLEFVTKSVIT